VRKALERLLAEDEAGPQYDPVHVATVLIVTLASFGALYWMLWTLLVYEGGLFLKVRALLSVAFTGKTLKDFGYEGTPFAQGAFAGWFGNLAALAVCAAALAALIRLYRDGARRSGRKG
jgi:hypothetical protein